jgi:hypothetical protein
VASGYKEQIQDDPWALNATVGGFANQESNSDCRHESKQKRMGEASMSPESAVRNANVKSDDVNIGQYRKEGTRNP